MATLVWRSETDNKLYHDLCFEEGEARDGYVPVKLDELDDDDVCESCGGVFLIGVIETGHTPDDDEDEDSEEES